MSNNSVAAAFWEQKKFHSCTLLLIIAIKTKIILHNNFLRPNGTLLNKPVEQTELKMSCTKREECNMQ